MSDEELDHKERDGLRLEIDWHCEHATKQDGVIGALKAERDALRSALRKAGEALEALLASENGLLGGGYGSHGSLRWRPSPRPRCFAGDGTMSIDWTDEAIEAAEGVINRDFPYSPETETVRAALDAAVKAQGRIYEAFYREAVQQARAEALEEAAIELEAEDDHIAAQIVRALKETKG